MALKKARLASLPLICAAAAMVVWLGPFPPPAAEEIHADNIRQYSEYIEQCLDYSRRGRHEKVIPLAKEAIKLAPHEPRAYNYLSVSYAALGDYEKALEASRTYLDLLEARHALTIHAVARHADFLRRSKGVQGAVTFLEGYRTKFPEAIDACLEAVKRAE
jgi:tetratricopeptide (TPR) repeat protein